MRIGLFFTLFKRFLVSRWSNLVSLVFRATVEVNKKDIETFISSDTIKTLSNMMSSMTSPLIFWRFQGVNSWIVANKLHHYVWQSPKYVSDEFALSCGKLARTNRMSHSASTDVFKATIETLEKGVKWIQSEQNHQNDVIDVVLVFSLLTLNIFSHIFLVFLLLSLNRQMLAGRMLCFYC